MLKYNPDTLVNYVAQAYGDYVRSLCLQWMPLLRHDNSKTVDKKHVETVCDMLQNKLACVLIPSQVANDVTVKLLTHVDKLFKFTTWDKFTSDDTFILLNVTSILIHPAVTELNLLYEKYLQEWKVIDYPVHEKLGQLRLLKILHLRPELCPEISNFRSQNLQELTMSALDNTLLEKFSISFCNLRKICILCGTIHDVTVKFLLKFTKLEDLDIKGTYNNGLKVMTALLKGLAQNTDANGTPLLKKFNCGYLTPRQFDFVARTFHLVSFYASRTTNLPSLSHMSHLRSLTIGENSFSFIKRVLCRVGYQLSHLDFTSTSPVDLCAVADCCPFLVSFTMSCHKGEMLRDSDEFLPSFSNLKVVKLHLSNCPKLLTCILANCTSVKVLKVEYIRRHEEVNIADVLQRNTFRYMEDLLWESDVTSDLGIEVLRHCQMLHNYIWRIVKRAPLLQYIDPHALI